MFSVIKTFFETPLVVDVMNLLYFLNLDAPYKTAGLRILETAIILILLDHRDAEYKEENLED